MEPLPPAPKSREREFFERLAIPAARLAEVARAKRAEWLAARPFPHVVIDGLFDEYVLDRVLDEFPGPKDIDWIRFDTPHEVKLATRDESQLGWLTRTLIGYLNSSTFLTFVEEITGISGLVGDPHLDGGGLHQIPPGGKLDLHTDFLTQQRLKLDRRLNILLWLNRDWEEAWGGHLELWDKDVTRCEKKILPVFNRIALFNTTAHSMHGHPEPLRCPPGRFRRSIALYYYSNGRPAEEAGGVHPTVFRLRPGERARFRFRQVMKKLLPPILGEMRYWFR